MWFTETPWPPIIICGVLAALLWGAWLNNARPRYLIIIGLLALVAVGLWFLEEALVSPKEQMEQTHFDLVAAFEDERVDDVINYISQNERDKYGPMIKLGAELVEVPGKLSVPTPSIEFQSQQTRAVSQMHVNGKILVRGNPHDVVSLWELTWQLEAGEWKIIDIRRLNPVNKTDMGLLE